MALRFKIASPQSTATEQAIGWYARQRSKPLSEEDAARFAAWLKDDAAHVAAWKEVVAAQTALAPETVRIAHTALPAAVPALA